MKWFLAMLAIAQWLPDQKSSTGGAAPTPPVNPNVTWPYYGF